MIGRLPALYSGSHSSLFHSLLNILRHVILCTEATDTRNAVRASVASIHLHGVSQKTQRFKINGKPSSRKTVNLGV